MTDSRIRLRERDAVIQSLRAGVVPHSGQHHIQVGRADEVQALVSDLARIIDGGSAVRFVIGDYGSGKTFFLQLIRAVALEKRLVTLHADLGPDRRLHATGGQARGLYAELTRNLATRAKPEGGALPGVVERFVSQSLAQAREHGVSTESVIHRRLAELSELTGGYDFAEVVACYWTGHEAGNEQLKSDALRWLRGEFATRTDARRALGVRTIVDDANVYDQLKLLALFVTQAGFDGLLVCLDEMVNLYKLANTQARNSNYEQILRILNDCLQGSAAHLGFVFGGTPEFLTDTRRGLYSYTALQSRLAENTYVSEGLVDHSGPVLRLASLFPEDFYVLLSKLRHVYAAGDEAAYLIPDEAIEAFMAHCSSRIGDAYFRTPRNTITQFINLLAVLEQNPAADWRNLVGAVHIPADVNPDLLPLEDEEPEGSKGPERVLRGYGAPAGAAPEEAAGAPRDDDDLATFRL
jgi:P-loop Domain of unknown function (DUF2791)